MPRIASERTSVLSRCKKDWKTFGLKARHAAPTTIGCPYASDTALPHRPWNCGTPALVKSKIARSTPIIKAANIRAR
jgi:hypothetical protein